MERVAIVTGANRGLGFEIVRQLAAQDIQVVLTARDKHKGKEALQSLKEEGLDAVFHPLDVTSEASIDKLVSFMDIEFGRCDILINCAGVFPDIMHDGEEDHDRGDTEGALHVSLDKVRAALETNTLAPLMLCQKLIPLMQKNDYGRIVNISSGLGQLSDVEDSQFLAYRVSKTALNMVTTTLAMALKDTNILVNSVCPGWCRTRMGGPHANRSPEEGAAGVVYLATLPDRGPTGGFFRDKKAISW